MADKDSKSSDSDTDDIDSCIWTLKKRKSRTNKRTENSDLQIEIDTFSAKKYSLFDKVQKFEELKEKSHHMQKISAQKLHKAEKRRTKKLLKKALKDPLVKKLVEETKTSIDGRQESSSKNEAEEWKTVKPFIDINNHLQGPVSHGDWGPKTELESTIDDAIKDGDFEKAELLSDTLANREFAVKITKAYAAKRYHEQLEKEKLINKDKNAKKIRWTFDAKERWQMKGNM